MYEKKIVKNALSGLLVTEPKISIVNLFMRLNILLRPNVFIQLIMYVNFYLY